MYKIVANVMTGNVAQVELTQDEIAEISARNAESLGSSVVTIRQAKLALHNAGLLDAVDSAVAAAGRAVQIEWEYATEVRRDWPTLLALQSTLGLTDEQVDSLFSAAAAL